MPRPLRPPSAGLIQHALNRANARLPLFAKNADYAAFERILEEAHHRLPSLRILAYCLMPNHFHLVLHPARGHAHAHDLSDFMRWLTLTHTQRHHAHRRTSGHGHLYQGRFKSFPVQDDSHFLSLCRYVERNPLRAKLVKRAELWPFSSLHRRLHGTPEQQSLLSPWPIDPPRRDYLAWVNSSQPKSEEQLIQTSITRGRPLGVPAWTLRTAQRLGLERTLRPRGRPRKKPVGQSAQITR
jgi:putative transposase